MWINVHRWALRIGTLLILSGGPGAVAQPPETIPVFIAGDIHIAGVENASEQYAQFREQNVLVTKSGRVVVICQARNHSNWSDRSGQDLVCRWSDDQGTTWSTAHMISTHGKHSICPNAAVYDRETGKIHVLYNLFTWDFDKKPPKNIRGEMGEQTCPQYELVSADDGVTWTAPRDITDMIDTHGAVAVFGSGEGIQLRHGQDKGRLIISGGDFYQGKKVLCYYSDNHGITWQRGTPVPTPGTMAMASESKVAELPAGNLVLNSRTFHQDGSKQRLRTRAFSDDGGLTWTTLANDPALKTVSCNGSLISVAHDAGTNGAILLCSVPVGPKRTHGTVYVSFDEGKTWPTQKLVVPGEFAYSSLVELADGRIGLFYESRGHKDIVLARFDLNWLLQE